MYWLPDKLSPELNVLWEVPLGKAGLGGIAATPQYVFFGDRDLDDFQDIYRCLDATTGEQHWEVQQLAIGTLDYGNSPRATPLIDGENVIFLGAFGDLVCVQIATGNILWHLNLKSEFKPDSELPWGYCGSPLMIDGKLIINPGAKDASVVALDPKDGSLIWKSPGLPAAYGSFIGGNFGSQKQIVGQDAKTICGWEVTTGKRMWTIEPPYGSEFHVPTPINVNGNLLISGEQNGTRLYAFNEAGIAHEEPISHNQQLTPDMSTPVVSGDFLFCVNKFLYCLKVNNGLKEEWRLRDKALSDYGSLIASQDRLLVIGDGELLLMATNGNEDIISRQRIFDDNNRLYAHPALVGSKLFVRGETRLKCIELDSPGK